MSAWAWPQWIAAAWIVVRFLVWVWKDAQANDLTALAASFAVSGTTIWVLWMGGFWS